MLDWYRDEYFGINPMDYQHLKFKRHNLTGALGVKVLLSSGVEGAVLQLLCLGFMPLGCSLGLLRTIEHALTL